MDYSLKTISQLRPILLGFRKTAGLTQAMMASQLGVTQQTYAQFEANPASASVDRLFKVLRVLNVELALTGSSPAAPRKADPDTSKRSPKTGRFMTRNESGSPTKPTPVIKKRENW